MLLEVTHVGYSAGTGRHSEEIIIQVLWEAPMRELQPSSPQLPFTHGCSAVRVPQ